MWLGKLTALDMTPLGWLGRKTSTQTNWLAQHDLNSVDWAVKLPTQRPNLDASFTWWGMVSCDTSLSSICLWHPSYRWSLAGPFSCRLANFLVLMENNNKWNIWTKRWALFYEKNTVNVISWFILLQRFSKIDIDESILVIMFILVACVSGTWKLF